jgi:hypothetical protein
MCEAIANQRDYDRPLVELADLSDVLIVGMVLGDALRLPAPREIDIEGIAAFQSIGLKAAECEAVLKESEEQLTSLQDALGC